MRERVENRKLILLKSSEMRQKNDPESEKKRREFEKRLSELQSKARNIEKKSGDTE